MTLDLLQVAPQIGAMAREVGERRRANARRREVALSLLAAWNARLAELRALAQQEQPWLVADPLEPLLARYPAPTLPPDVTVVATDGSSIDLDRHGLAQCYLINVGGAVIRYGAQPDAALTSRAALYYRDDDLYLDNGGARVPVQGALVDLKRTLAEQQRALGLARAARGRGPVVAVADGTLLLWQLLARATQDDYVAGLYAAYAAGLEEFERLGVPVCSYVSRPNGRDLVNLLRVAACPTPHPSKSKGEDDGLASSPLPPPLAMPTPPTAPTSPGMSAPPATPILPAGATPPAVPTPLAFPIEVSRETALGAVSRLTSIDNLPSPAHGGGVGGGGSCCHHGQCLRDLLEPLPDRALMAHLAPGERSARFASRAAVLSHYGPRARVQVVYLNVGSEIARVEVPAWVGDDPALLNLVHAVVYDGCTRGWGYPPALAEAHEQAVIRGPEREAFMRMVMEALNVEGQPAELSLKQLSKNRRAV